MSGKLSNSLCGIDLKLNLKKNANVNENAQISKSIIKIDQRGKLYFQKYSSNLCINVKVHF